MGLFLASSVNCSSFVSLFTLIIFVSTVMAFLSPNSMVVCIDKLRVPIITQVGLYAGLGRRRPVSPPLHGLWSYS